MAFAEDDVLQVKLSGTYLGQDIQNILTYNIVDFGLSADIDTILDTLEDFLLPLFVNLQVDGMEWTGVRIDNLTDTLSFAERAVSVEGVILTAGMPSYVAGGFTKLVGSKLTRPGAMRLAGIPEDNVLDNTWSPNVPFRQSLEIALGSVLSNGLAPPNEINIDPIVARLVTPGPPAVYAENKISSVAFRSLITTQNSRKQ